MLTLDTHTKTLVELLKEQAEDISPLIEKALSQLSAEHPSGIMLAQLDTPMMKQFKTVKEEVPDGLVFFRMGDFFELFGVDAVVASVVCGLTLTSRDKSSTQPVPMAGVPASSYKTSLRKCILAGFKVVVCDQIEDPKLAKSIVRRDIVRIATPAVPGDLFEDDNTRGSVMGCYLVSVISSKKGYSLACVDAATSEFKVTGGLTRVQLEQELLTLEPKEILTNAEHLNNLKELAKTLWSRPGLVNSMDTWILKNHREAMTVFCEFFEVAQFEKFGLSQIENSLACVVSLLTYLRQTQRQVLKNINKIQVYTLVNCLKLDDATKKHLDFFTSSQGDRKGSLYWLLNHCVTQSGMRALASRMNYPFINMEVINQHLNRLDWLIENMDFCLILKTALKKTMDLDRFLSNCSLGSADARGLVWLRSTLETLSLVNLEMSSRTLPGCFQEIATAISRGLGATVSLYQSLVIAFVDEPAPIIGKGSRTFKEGFCHELDEIISLESGLDQKLQALEDFEKKKCGISTLKIGYSRSFGYFFEVSKGKVDQVPGHFIRKQTLTNGERYYTEELKDLEQKALSASDKRLVLEKSHLANSVAQVLNFAQPLSALNALVAEFDVLQSFGTVAMEQEWCRPTVVEEPVSIVKGSVHPVLKKFMSQGARGFIPNDFELGNLDSTKRDVTLTGPDSSFLPFSQDDRQLCPVLLITGPNMAGKSTMMRQVALSQVLMQMGSYVPAAFATLGICDGIYTRIGSADNILKNQSTFMVEMVETSNILSQATSKSLLLLDEIGRGTSTYDGLSLAWSILEDLTDRIGARTLFSTHYHELCKLADLRKNIKLMQMGVVEDPSRGIIFSRRFLEGSSGKSYGIHVATLAGISKNVTLRAQEILQTLEKKNVELGNSTNSPDHLGDTTNRIEGATSDKLESKNQALENHSSKRQIFEDAVLELITGLEINRTTPLEALNVLNLLKCLSSREITVEFAYSAIQQISGLAKKKFGDTSKTNKETKVTDTLF